MASDIQLKDFSAALRRRISEAYPPGEAEALSRIVLEEMLHRSPVDTVLKADEPVSPFMQGKVDEVVARLMRHEPVQYIFGKTSFYGLTLKVAPGVLIPRPETAELVDMIVSDCGDKTDLAVIDLCTGSGCIAVALARYLKFATVEAVDISDEAVAVARENVAALKVNVKVDKGDALRLDAAGGPKWDVIVSNPPYVAEHEKGGMEANVLDYEPHAALFVPDDDPLKFYKAIAAYAVKALKPGGRLYFEINPLFAAGIEALLAGLGFRDVNLCNDMYGRKRFAVAVSPDSP